MNRDRSFASILFLILVLAAATIPGRVAAQQATEAEHLCTEVAVGDPVKIRPTGARNAWKGTLLSRDAEAITAVDGEQQITLPWIMVDRVQVECRRAEPGGNRAGRGFAIGFAAGAIGAGALTLWVADVVGASGGSALGGALGAAAIGGLGVGALGALIGLTIPAERRWVNVGPPAEGGPRPTLEIAPAPGADGAWSIGLRIPVDGP